MTDTTISMTTLYMSLLVVIFERPKNPSVVQLSAHDPDGEDFNKIRFSIVNITFTSPKRTFPPFGAFVINPDTGLLTVGFPVYKAFLEGKFKILVKAEDVVDPTLFSTTNVYVSTCVLINTTNVYVSTCVLFSTTNVLSTCALFNTTNIYIYIYIYHVSPSQAI